MTLPYKLHSVPYKFQNLWGPKHFEVKVEVKAKAKAKAKLTPVKNSGGMPPPEFLTGVSLALALALTLTSTLTSKCFVPYKF